MKIKLNLISINIMVLKPYRIDQFNRRQITVLIRFGELGWKVAELELDWVNWRSDRQTERTNWFPLNRTIQYKSSFSLILRCWY